MAHFNSFQILGNLTRDPELKIIERDGKDDLAICNFGIAANKPGNDDKPFFIDATVFGSQAEACKDYLKKGCLIFAAGELEYRSWEDEETKKKLSKISLIAGTVQFLNSKENSGDTAGEKTKKQKNEK